MDEKKVALNNFHENYENMDNGNMNINMKKGIIKLCFTINIFSL